MKEENEEKKRVARVEFDKRFKEIVMSQLGVTDENFRLNARIIEDIGADSLDHVELIIAFEEQFGIDLPSEAEEKQTLGELADYVFGWYYSYTK